MNCSRVLGRRARCKPPPASPVKQEQSPTLALSRLKHENVTIALVTRAVAEHVEPGSVLIAQGGLLQHLDFPGDWRLAPEEAFDRRVRPPRPLGPGGLGADQEPGPVEEITPTQRTGTFRREIAHWAADARKLYWLTTEAQLKAVHDRLEPGQDEFVTIAEVKVPGRSGPPPEFGDDRPGPGPGGPRRGWAGPPPDGRGRGLPAPPAHFEPPEDGKLVLVRWTIR